MRTISAGRLCWTASLALVLGCSARAADLERRLSDGTRLEIDSNTNRVMAINPRGVATPLWDGVHTLSDGSTLTIRSGVMLPNLPITEAERRARSRASAPTPAGAGAANVESPCARLVKSVCGARQQCAEGAPCSPAMQLLEMEDREKAGDGDPTHMTHTSYSCSEALHDQAFFAPCAR